MERLGPTVKALLAFGLALHLHFHIHHHIKGPPVDYVGLAAAAGASWIGVPGPGEPVLIALGVFAARHNFDITSVVVVAFLGAAGGGLAGWLIGLKAGRRILTARGPLHKMRLHALARGDEIFDRHPVLGILLTPSVLAGIHRVPPLVYNVTNLVSAAVWAAGIGYGAYFVGPPIVDLVNDMGLITGIALGVLVVGSVGAGMIRRRRHELRAERNARER
jgi:membrane protein DedA with SNARE-associated domain